MVAHLQLVVRCGRGGGQCSAAEESGTCLGPTLIGRLYSYIQYQSVELEEREEGAF